MGKCETEFVKVGHFPDQAYTYTQEEAADESRGAWYVRQLVGAANIEGSPLFHVASGMIHLLLIVAVISLVLHFVRGRRIA